MFPVGGVEGYRVGFYEEVVWSKAREGMIGGEVGGAGGGYDEGFLGGGGHFLGGW